MNITQKSTAELTLQLEMQVTESDYSEKVKNSLTQYRKQANVPGFRPGMVPMGMIKKQYGESVTAEIVSNLIGEELDKYIKEQKLEILGQPMPDHENQKLIDFRNEKEFTFYYKVGVKPEIDFKVDGSYKIVYNKLMAQDEDVEKYVEESRLKMGSQSNPDVASDNDVIMGTMSELSEDGKELKDGGISNEKATFSVEKIKLKTIKTKFVGKKVGTKVKFNAAKAFKSDAELATILGITAPEAAELKGDFQFEIVEISHIEPAEMNEEFFSKVYENSDIKTEAELRARITEDIEKSYEAESDRNFYNEVIEAIIAKTDLNLPDEFLKTWILESNRREEKDTQISKEELDAQYVGYRDTLRWQLLEEDLIVKNDLITTEQELRDRVSEILGLQAFGGKTEGSEEILKQVTESVMQDKEQIRQVSQQIVEQKLTKLFKDSVKPEEVNISYDDFVKMMEKKAEALKKKQAK